jgi:ABC-type multidrug transport system ATPase subunit
MDVTYHRHSFNDMTLEFDGIEFGYDGKDLLTGIHMKCDVGKVVGLLGRNGTGKSTLMKIVFGAIHTDVGSVRINNVPVPSPAFLSRKISYLPQDQFLPANLRLKSIMNFYAVSRERLLAHFPELEEDLELFKDQVSGGRLRLFECLLILLGRSSFCLLDEPFTGLSPVFIERLQQVIVHEKRNKGVILSDHMYRDVLEIADSIYVLSNGRTFEVTEEEGLVRRGYLV